ncbi:hypothetical protein JTB14_019468 [Gonioctena quinquepunctata]|nr:hypothetical protein JTB14_019468 [Gonioctena quinquepunctata]
METRGLAKWSISLFFCPEEDATHSTDGSSPTKIYPNKHQDTTQLEDNYKSSPNACLQKAVTNTLFLNIRSLSNKMDESELSIGERNYDFICLCEHWLNDLAINAHNLENYTIANHCRKTYKGGGVMIYIEDTFTSKELDNSNIHLQEKDFEITGVEIMNINIMIICIYRPPSG